MFSFAIVCGASKDTLEISKMFGYLHSYQHDNDNIVAQPTKIIRLTQIQTGSWVMKLATSFSWLVNELVSLRPASSKTLSCSSVFSSPFLSSEDVSDEVSEESNSLFVSTAIASFDDLSSDAGRDGE